MTRAERRPVRFRIATANLGRGVTVPRFRANVRTLLRRLGGAVICFQEIDEDDLPEERRIVGLALRAGWWFAGRRTKVMIAVPRTWKRLDGRVTKAADGIAGVSPTRYVVTSIIRHRRTRSELAVVNVHFPYANPKHAPDTQARARNAWVDVDTALRGEVARLVRAGHTVFVCADTNDRDTPAPHHDARLLVGRGAIDKIWVVPGAVAVQLVATGVVDLTIDGHNAHVARTLLARRDPR